MIEFYLKCAPAGDDIETGELAESPSDEADIIANQDETLGGSPQKADAAMGGMGTRDLGADNGRFARGEADLVEQMSRTTQRMDKAAGRKDDPFEGFETESPDLDPTI